MMNVFGVIGVPRESGRGASIGGGDGTAAVVAGVEIGQRQSQPRRLELGHPEVLRNVGVHVVLAHPVDASTPYNRGEAVVVGDDDAAITDATEVLGGVEA